MKFAYCLFVLIILEGCTERINNRKYTIDGLTIIDYSRESSSLCDSSHEIIFEGIPVYYLGKRNSSVLLNANPISRHIAIFKNGDNPTIELDSNTIKLKVYDSIETSMLLYKENAIDEEHAYAANLILIENTSDNYISVGIANLLTGLCIETQTEDLNWKIIDNQLTSVMCGTGLNELILQPKGIVLGKILKHKGKAKLKCRIKYKSEKGNVYSNEFIDF